MNLYQDKHERKCNVYLLPFPHVFEFCLQEDALIWLEDGESITDNWLKNQPDFSGGKEYCVDVNWGSKDTGTFFVT